MSSLRETTGTAPAGSLLPEPYRVVGRHEELADVVTLSLEPLHGERVRFRHGQFNMLTAFGCGEIAISMSSAPGEPGALRHTIRRVGAASGALCSAPVGSVVGVRGAFGTSWGVDELEDGLDVVVMAGGIGLAPLIGAVRDLVARQREGRGRVVVLVGARSPDQILFEDDLRAWREDGVHVAVSVDSGDTSWDGVVGVVTALLPDAPIDRGAKALLCGPEVMMRFGARALVDRGLDPGRIRVSLERNMQCGVGLCGHCQFGPLLVCRDGPIVTYGGLADWLFMQRYR